VSVSSPFPSVGGVDQGQRGPSCGFLDRSGSFFPPFFFLSDRVTSSFFFLRQPVPIGRGFPISTTFFPPFFLFFYGRDLFDVSLTHSVQTSATPSPSFSLQNRDLILSARRSMYTCSRWGKSFFPSPSPPFSKMRLGGGYYSSSSVFSFLAHVEAFPFLAGERSFCFGVRLLAPRPPVPPSFFFPPS